MMILKKPGYLIGSVIGGLICQSVLNSSAPCVAFGFVFSLAAGELMCRVGLIK